MDYCILLTSNLDSTYLNNVNMLKNYFKLHDIPFEEIDGASEENQGVRTALFDFALRSGGKAEYPLLFIMRSGRNLQFVGNFDQIQNVLDNGYYEGDMQERPVELCTFERYFPLIYRH